MIHPSHIPADFLPLPEGCVLLGTGDQFEHDHVIEGHVIHASNPDRWVPCARARGSADLAYAVERGSPLAQRNAELVLRLNPSLLEQPPANTLTPESLPDPLAAANPELVARYNSPRLPDYYAPLPPDFVFVGRAGEIEFPPQAHNYPNDLQWADTGGGWITNPILTHSQGFYAIRRDSALRHLITIRTAGPPEPENWMPPLPEVYTYLGVGGSFPRLDPPNCEAMLVTEGNPRWRRSQTGGLVGARPDSYYAIPSPPAPSVVSTQNPVSADPAPYGRRQWLITLNGVPVSSLSELENLCSHLISKEENLTPLTDCLWRALEYDDPESRLEDWASREPLLLMVDFLPARDADNVLMPAVIESSKSIGEIITTAAAGVLLRGGLSNHFHYTEDGRLVINPSSPPSLEQGCEILKRTLEVRETSQKLDNYSAWTLGMLWDELDRFFGDDFDPSLVMEATGRCYNTAVTSLKVYRELWANRRNLSFTHHKEALYAKVEPEDTAFILDTADRLRLSVAQQRKLTSFVRVYGSSSFIEEPPDNAELLMERLEVKSVNKNYLFFLRSENKWFKYRGPFEHIPNGASTIINADTRAMLDAEGRPTELSDWKPVGVEMPYVRGHSATIEAHRAEALPADGEVLPSQGGNTDRLDSVDEERVINSLVSQVIINQVASVLEEAASDGSAMVDPRAPEIFEELASTQEVTPQHQAAIDLREVL